MCAAISRWLGALNRISTCARPLRCGYRGTVDGAMETVNLEALAPLGLVVGFPHELLASIVGYGLRRRGVRVVIQALALSV